MKQQGKKFDNACFMNRAGKNAEVGACCPSKVCSAFGIVLYLVNIEFSFNGSILL